MPHTNKQLQKEAARRHYLKNIIKMKQKALFHNKQSIIRNREYVDKYLKTHPCIDCGESDNVVLEFDHVRGEKKRNISDMILKAFSINAIKTEIEKCDVRCANCHRRVTYIRRLNIGS